MAAVLRTFLAFILLAGAGPSLAHQSICEEGCVSERSACRLAASSTGVACRVSCRTLAVDAAAVHTCRRECLSEYRLARNACSTELRESCLGLCDDGSICIDACGEQLRRCATALGKRGRPCRRLCKHDPSILGCRAACLDAWVGGCRGGVQACAAGCTAITTTTTTLLPPLPGCGGNPAGGPDG